MRAPWVRKLGQGAVLVGVLLAVVVVRVVWSSRTEWRAAEAARAAGGAEAEVTALGRAARLYAPGNPYSRRAVERLAEIGRAEPARALAAWREVRSALLATRSFYTPRAALLAEADAAIAGLMAESEAAGAGGGAGGQGDGKSREAARAWHAARLAQAEHDAPSVAWTLVALLGLAAWIGCAAGLLLRGIGDDDRLRKRPALAWAAGFTAGLLLFFVGLWRA
jgi:hypothetical protein